MPSRLQPPPTSVSGGGYAGDIMNTSAHTNVTPSRKDSRSAIDSKRKQTLLSLLEALSELQRDEDATLSGSSSHVKLEKLEEPTEVADEQLQKGGAEVFNKFQKRINNLDRELRNFANASRQLGSSVGILSSAFHLRERIAQIQFLFRENAADLFPRKVQRQSVEAYADQKNRAQESSAGKRRRYTHKVIPHVARPVLQEKPDPEDFPEQMEGFAKDVMTFLKSLNEFPEFTDEALNSSINSFEADLMYWASCLRTYEGQFRYHEVQRYLHDLCEEMGGHLDTITSSLSMFLEIGIPTIRFAQKHAAENLLNLTTVATFFSAVTATTLQFSFSFTHHPLADAVNSFWFLSLVFSIASAVNSLLGLTWKQAMYRSPGHRVPWWVLIWIKRSPLIFLVISVAAFSLGLCIFAYSSNQHHVTSTLTTVFTAFSSFGLLAVSAWFTFERWTFNRHRGKKWLMDVLSEITAETRKILLIDWFKRVPVKHAKRIISRANRRLSSVGSAITRIGMMMSSIVVMRKESNGQDEPNDNEENANSSNEKVEQISPVSPIRSSPSVELLGSYGGTSTPLPSSTSAASLSLAPSEGATSDSTPSMGNGRARFKGVVRNVMRMQQTAGGNSPTVGTAVGLAVGALSSAIRQRTASSSAFTSGMDPGIRDEQVTSSVRVSRVATLMPALKAMQPMQLLQQHSALVRHLQFSPNGEFLATCSWDRTCAIFKVKDFSTPHRVLAHPQGFVGQVAWSPKGDLLLTKMSRGMKIWAAESGVCRKTIDRQRSVQSVTWFPQGEAFLSVEGSNVAKLDINGKIIDTYTFERVILHDVAITSDQQRMVCVATLTASPDGFRPSVSREEKQIIVYNLDKKEIENQVPVLHDVRDITLAKDGNIALVSYEHKAPPQLWKLKLLKDRTEETDGVIARLSLIHTYMPKSPVDFAGSSYFGGTDDQLVLCAGKSGDIHIWDRGSGFLLHSFQAQELEGGMTCIAWNTAATPFMFATGSHDGTVRIWTAPPHVPSRNSYIDLRQSGSNTPRTLTPPLPAFAPSFTFEVMDRVESPIDHDRLDPYSMLAQNSSLGSRSRANSPDGSKSTIRNAT